MTILRTRNAVVKVPTSIKGDRSARVWVLYVKLPSTAWYDPGLSRIRTLRVSEQYAIPKSVLRFIASVVAFTSNVAERVAFVAEVLLSGLCAQCVAGVTSLPAIVAVT